MFRLNELEKLFTQGKISRREFLSRVSALGLMAAVSPALLSSKAEAATPKKGGRFRQAFSTGSTTDSLDPTTVLGSAMMINIGWTYANNLVEIDANGAAVPELAEKIETSDAKTWYFRLRKGVEFHNGKSLTADDVVTSVSRHIGENSKSTIKGSLKQVTDMRKDGDHTVVFELEGPNADFPFILSAYNLQILPTGPDGKLIDPLTGIGTGPYSVVNFDPGVRVEFKRFPNYWKEGRGHFDEVETRVIPDATARQNALMTGAIDCMDNVDPKVVKLLARAPKVKILETTGMESRHMPMRLDTPPFDNSDVRMALKLGVKRQELVDKILLGHGALGNDHPISPAQEYFNTELPQREYDPDKARYHIKKAGMEGTELVLHVSETALEGTIDAGLLMQASMAPAGIKVKVSREPRDGYWSNIWNKKGVGWCASYWSGRPTNDWMFTTCCMPESNWNDGAWRGTEASEKFSKLVVAARGELNKDKRREMYWECQRLINEDGGAIHWCYSNLLSAQGKKVMYPEKVSGQWAVDGGKNAERWWFA